MLTRTRPRTTAYLAATKLACCRPLTVYIPHLHPDFRLRPTVQAET